MLTISSTRIGLFIFLKERPEVRDNEYYIAEDFAENNSTDWNWSKFGVEVSPLSRFFASGVYAGIFKSAINQSYYAQICSFYRAKLHLRKRRCDWSIDELKKKNLALSYHSVSPLRVLPKTYTYKIVLHKGVRLLNKYMANLLYRFH